MKVRHRTSLKRKIGGRAPKKKVFVYTEGTSSEPKYIKGYERKVYSSILEVHCQKETGVPKTLLELAIKKKSEIRGRSYRKLNGDNDQVWLVFDRDQHVDVQSIISRCKDVGIELAYSNPCFEVWLLLHYEDYDCAEDGKSTQRRCEQVCPGYDRRSGKIPDLDKLLEYVETAEKRADALCKRRAQDGGEIPFTSVQNLTRMIRTT